MTGSEGRVLPTVNATVDTTKCCRRRARVQHGLIPDTWLESAEETREALDERLQPWTSPPSCCRSPDVPKRWPRKSEQGEWNLCDNNPGVRPEKGGRRAPPPRRDVSASATPRGRARRWTSRLPDDLYFLPVATSQSRPRGTHHRGPARCEPAARRPSPTAGRSPRRCCRCNELLGELASPFRHAGNERGIVSQTSWNDVARHMS